MRDRLLQVPMEIRPDIGTALATGSTYEPALKIGQPYIVRPLISADPDPVRALVVGAIDQQTANAGGAHLAEGDFLRAAHGTGFVPAGQFFDVLPRRGREGIFALWT